MSVLKDIIEVKKQEVEKLRALYNYKHFKQSDLFNRKKLSLNKSLNSENQIALIAEIKKANGQTHAAVSRTQQTPGFEKNINATLRNISAELTNKFLSKYMGY